MIWNLTAVDCVFTTLVARLPLPPPSRLPRVPVLPRPREEDDDVAAASVLGVLKGLPRGLDGGFGAAVCEQLKRLWPNWLQMPQRFVLDCGRGTGLGSP